MPSIADRVRETTTTTGTGTVNLEGAVTGFQMFSNAFSTGTEVYYCISDGTNWEIGYGAVTTGSPWTLARSTVLQSSNADALVNFGAGIKDVFCTMPAQAFIAANISNTPAGNITATTVQAAINEMDGEKAALAGSSAQAFSASNFTTGQGLVFPATQNPSANANTLDDYEEGTFTPTIIGTTAAGVGTYTVQVGKYTKVGNCVYIQIALDISAHTGTGGMAISGLPFVAATTASGYGALNPTQTNNMTLTASNVFEGARVNAGTATASFIQTPVGGGATSSVSIDTSFLVYLVGHYFTA